MGLVKGLKKRILAFMLAISLSFSVCAVDYMEVYALEWVTAEIGLDSLFSMMFSCLGISLIYDVSTDEDYENLKDDLGNYLIDEKAVSEDDFTQWWDNCVKGFVSTSSDCWQGFKEWCQSLINSYSSEDDWSSGGSFVSDDILELIQKIDPSIATEGFPSGITFDEPIIIVCPTTHVAIIYYLATNQNYLNLSSVSALTIGFNGKNIGIKNIFDNSYKCYYLNAYSPTSWNYSSPNLLTSNFEIYNTAMGDADNFLNLNLYCYGFNSSLDLPSSVTNGYNITYNYLWHNLNLSDYKLKWLVPNVENLDVYNNDITSLEDNDGFTLPTAETDLQSLQDLINALNEGTTSLEDYIEQVQALTDTITTYEDSETGEDILVPENTVTPTLNDVITVNSNNLSYVLSGLENVFPFCIPWDIYDFVTLLVADPVAPVIEYPIYNPVTEENNIITIDFSQWETVVIIFRYIFDFLLIIGLLLMARSLIGAGGSDS